MASLGHPSKFQRVSRLGSVTARHSSSGRQPNFATLNTGRHLCSAGRPSRWTLAHILVTQSFAGRMLLQTPNHQYQSTESSLQNVQKVVDKCSAVAEMGDRLATIVMGRKLGAVAPFLGGGAGFPSNTMSPGPKPTSVPSFILIRATVWPQYTDRTDNGPIA